MNALRDRILLLIGKTTATAMPITLLAACSAVEGVSDPCLDAGKTYTTLSQGEWKQQLGQGAPDNGEYIVCSPRSAGLCAPSEQMSEEDRYAFTQRVFGPFMCSGNPEPSYTGQTFCGPLERRADECCYVIALSFSTCVEGRPFIVEGEVRLADVARRDGWCEPRVIAGMDALPADLREEVMLYWAQVGTHEHASVASFARFAMDLLSLGAPRELVSATTRAMEDEIRHAYHCFSIASAYAGMPLGPSEVEVAGCMDHSGDLAMMLRDAIVEGCIGETIAASIAEWSASYIQDADVSEIVTQIAADEGDHALLAWQFVDWALTKHPELYEVARETLESVDASSLSPWAAGLSQSDRALLAHGCVPDAVDDHVRRRAYFEVVKPCGDALLARHRPASHQLAA